MSALSIHSVVEATDVVRELDKAKPAIFGPNGPYGQLFGLNMFILNRGLTVGTMLSGPLRDSIGYGNMMLSSPCCPRQLRSYPSGILGM